MEPMKLRINFSGPIANDAREQTHYSLRSVFISVIFLSGFKKSIWFGRSVGLVAANKSHEIIAANVTRRQIVLKKNCTSTIQLNGIQHSSCIERHRHHSGVFHSFYRSSYDFIQYAVFFIF